MRIIVCVSTLLFVMFTGSCVSMIAEDKWNHFAFSASVSSVSCAATSEPVVSAAVTIGLGLLKEVYDGWRGSGFQITDLAADIAGAITGSIAAAEICMEEFP